MTLIQDIFAANPVWVYFSIKHRTESLSSFSKNTLLSILKNLALNIVTSHVCKIYLIENIVKSFENKSIELTIKSECELLDICYTNSLIANQFVHSAMIASIMLKEYGPEIFYSFCQPDESNLNIKLTDACDLPWFHLAERSYVSYHYLNSACIKNIFMWLHPTQRPTIGKKTSMNYH